MFVLLVTGLIFLYEIKPTLPQQAFPLLARIERKDFDVYVKVVGELEASQSTIITSSIRGDQGKLIYLIPDGTNVKPGELLIKMDPTPFEEKLDKLKSQIKEQESYLKSLEQALEWEIVQAEHENKTAEVEIETAELELNKMRYGEGPLEISRLKGAMQKAWIKQEELNGYMQDLLVLEQQNFLNPNEMKQAQKKLSEEQEAYETVRLQYESYVNHVFPIQIKKAEMHLKRAQMKQEEVAKSGGYKIGKALALIEQSRQTLEEYLLQLKEGQTELALTEIKASAPGMVVHREEFRSGQKRKPRIGDILVKNQPLLDLPDLDSMVVKTKVREVDLFKVEIGKKATVEVDAYPHLTFSGTVTSIGVLALSDFTRTNEDKYFEVRLALDQGDQRLRPGMTVRVVIHTNQVKNGLAIPVHALFEEEKQHYCYIACQEGYEKRGVEIGIHNEQWAEVKTGLQEGDTIHLINPTLHEEE